MAKDWFEEEREVSTPWGWVIIILFAAAIVGYGALVHYLVDNGPRYWDVGQFPDTPAESVYSTEEPNREMTAPRQLPRLPEARREPVKAPPNAPLRERGPAR